jgi:hypothetical protein
VPTGTVTVAEPAPCTVICAVSLPCCPPWFSVMFRADLDGCPDAIAADNGQAMPPWTVTLLPNWPGG